MIIAALVHRTMLSYNLIRTVGYPFLMYVQARARTAPVAAPYIPPRGYWYWVNERWKEYPITTLLQENIVYFICQLAYNVRQWCWMPAACYLWHYIKINAERCAQINSSMRYVITQTLTNYNFERECSRGSFLKYFSYL